MSTEVKLHEEVTLNNVQTEHLIKSIELEQQDNDLNIGINGNTKSTVYTISGATTSNSGLMSASDKTKLNGISNGAQPHIAPTSEEVKSALGTGAGTTRYLREDGTWQVPQGGGGQPSLIFDNIPTEGSSNPVTSDGIKRAMDSQESTINSHINSVEADIASSISAVQSDVNSVETRVNGKLSIQDDKINALNGNDPIVGSLPSSGESGKIYRVPGVNSYTDYAWSNGQFVVLATYENAIDEQPMPGSNNLVKSGGVANMFYNLILEKTSNGEWWIPFDFKAGQKYYIHFEAVNCQTSTYLEAYKNLDSGPYETIFTESSGNYEKSITYIPSDDYVSLRFELGSSPGTPTFVCKIYTSAIDEEPVLFSDNLVKSGGVAKMFNGKVLEQISDSEWWVPYHFKANKKYIIYFKTENTGDRSTYLEAYESLTEYGGPYYTIFGPAYDQEHYYTFAPEKDYGSLRFETGSAGSETPTYTCIVYTSLSGEEIATTSEVNAIKKVTDEIEPFIYEGFVHIEDFYEDEMQKTVDSVNEITDEPCLSFAVITDTHQRLGDNRFPVRANRSINNVKHFNQKCYLDGVVHLGDLTDTVDIQQFSRKEQYAVMQDYLMKLSSANKHFYCTNGNHDGTNGVYTSEFEWYRIIGRLLRGDETIHAHPDAPYFYFDNDNTKTRCIFLSNPENPNDSGLLWGFSDREITWLMTAMNVPSDYNIMFFSHVPPFAESGTNNDKFKSLCNAFNNHTEWSSGSDSINFSNNTGKIVAFICGHWHEDLVCYPGWSHGAYVNDFPFVVVLLDLNYWNMPSSDGVGDLGGIRHGRVPDTYKEDLWTVLVYRPNKNRIDFIRFGAGDDFYVNV